MASSKGYFEYVSECLSALDKVAYRAMMGEYIIYYDGKVIGGIYDDRFLVKKTKSSLEFMPYASREIPYSGGSEMLLVDRIEDREFLAQLFNVMYRELPTPKKK